LLVYVEDVRAEVNQFAKIGKVVQP